MSLPALAPATSSRRTAVAELAAAAAATATLSFTAVAAAIQEHGLIGADVRLLLGELRAKGIALPAALVPLASPVNVAAGDISTRPAAGRQLRLLDGTEVLDLSRIALSDLFPAGSRPAVGRADVHRSEVDRSEVDRSEPDDRGEDLDEEDVPDIDLVALYRSQAGRARLLTAAEEVELAVAVEAGVLAQASSDDDPPPDVCRDLAELVELGRRAFDRFVSANLRLVLTIAVHYRGNGLDLLDLVQEGNLGLLRAVQKFDVREGTKFSTYASWWIRQAVSRGVADHARTIRYPVHVAERLRPVERAVSDAEGRAPSDDDVARMVGYPVTEVAALRTLPRCEPLDDVLAIYGENGVHDAAERYRFTPTVDLRGFEASDLTAALAECSDRERYVLERRHGLVGEPATLDTIGAEFGVTRERIRQIESSALKKVRAALARTPHA